MGRVLTIASTAIISSALTSVVWLLAFNSGDRSAQAAAQTAAHPAGHRANVVVPKVDEDARRASLAPSGMAIPVLGVKAAELLDTFKQSRAGGNRVHDAIDIMAPHGTPVVAAGAGTVEKLFFSKGGGGITVYVRSPDRRWMHYYAHLQEYAPGLREGMRVARGQALGRVGVTGNSNPNGPHLHFAIHRMEEGDGFWEGRAVNPYPLLAGRQRAVAPAEAGASGRGSAEVSLD